MNQQVVDTAAVVADVPAAPVAEVKAKRRPNVSDEAIITAWEKAKVEGRTASQVAEELNMLKASLVQRVQSLRSAGVLLSKLDRDKSSGGGAQKKDVEATKALLQRVREQLQRTDVPADDTNTGVTE